MKWQPFIQIHPYVNEKQQYIDLYYNNTKYYNSRTTERNTKILYLLVDLVNVYLELKFGCHSSFNIEFSM